MRESVFRKKYELYLHLIPNIFVWSSSIALTATGYMNNAGFGCWIASYPPNCANADSDEACIRGHKVFIIRWVFVAVPLILSLATCIILMIYVTSAAINTSSKKGKKKKGASSKNNLNQKEKKISMKLQRHSNKTSRGGGAQAKGDSLNASFPVAVPTRIPPLIEEEKEDSTNENKCQLSSKSSNWPISAGSQKCPPGKWPKRTRFSQSSEQDHETQSETQVSSKKNQRRVEADDGHHNALVSRVSSLFSNYASSRHSQHGTTKSSKSASNRNKEVVSQAFVFIAGLMGTYLLSFSNRFYEQIHGESPFWLHLLARTTLGFQGFLNVIVHTRPHIISLRKRKKEYSWFQAFVRVMMAGGDSDGNGRGMKRSKRRLSWISRHRPTTTSEPALPVQSTNNNKLSSGKNPKKQKSIMDVLESQQSSVNDYLNLRPKRSSTSMNTSNLSPGPKQKNDIRIGYRNSDKLDDSEYSASELCQIYEAAEYFQSKGMESV